MKTFRLIVLAFVCTWSPFDRPVAFAADQPNIVFIMADDLGWRDVEFAGAAFFETPHIDRLASQGMTFTAAYSGGPNCSPTRACLMTGTYTPRHHIYQPAGLSKGNPQHMRLLVPARERKDPELIKQAAEQFRITNSLAPEFVCIPEVLKPAGYVTARLGKWHLGDDTQGFDLSSANGKGGPGGRFYGEVHVTEQLTDRALKFMEENRDGPFFLYLPFWDVHTPLRAREDLVEKYRRKLEELPESEREKFNPVYAGMIEAVDTGVGRVMDKVDELGIAENTLIVFISDNGGTVSSQLDPLRGMKGSLFEAGVRVPACMRWTGRIEPGSTCETPITSVDFLPTCASLAGAELPTTQPVDGTDLTPLLDGEPIEERAIFWHYPLYLDGKGLTFTLPDGSTGSWRGFPSTSMRRGDWKLIEFHEDNTIGLYNLKDDPGETTNVSEQHPEVTHRMRAELDAWQEKTQAPIPTVANPECVLDAPSTHPSAKDIAPMTAMGLMFGEVSPTSVLVQTRLTRVNHPLHGEVLGRPGVVQFTLTPITDAGADNETAKPSVSELIEATADHDFIARAEFDDLQPGTKYRCETRIGVDEASLVAGPTGRFRTLPGPDADAEVRFVVVTGMNYSKFHGDDHFDRKRHVIENNTELPAPYAGADRYLGYPALESILKSDPDFFIGTGDNIYYDSPKEPRAQTITEMRQKWHEQFVQPRYVQLFAAVPTFWEIDDHDYRVDDCDNTGEYVPSSELGKRVMLEQLPYGPMNEETFKSYRTHRVSRDLQIWLTENRIYRSPNLSPDGPEKTIWGNEQKAWLKRTLSESDARFKVLISPTPMIGPDDLRKKDNHTNLGGFQHERDEFFAWLNDTGIARQGFSLVCGDRHWQYHSIHPSGIEEFSCGALVDANSRPGRLPGDPKSTDPEGLIRQPYRQETPSGGYLMVSVHPANQSRPSDLTFTHYDERGVVLNKHTKK
ncbi:MAG: sulfatase-like hydrolase/transferase [Planctomycetaceae bacterium]|nr:sulfatase-like hydrolase/transferase [Planctomycetaceae bacterium]